MKKCICTLFLLTCLSCAGLENKIVRTTGTLNLTMLDVIELVGIVVPHNRVYFPIEDDTMVILKKDFVPYVNSPRTKMLTFADVLALQEAVKNAPVGIVEYISESGILIKVNKSKLTER